MMICISDTTSRVLKNFNEGKNEHEKEISRKKLKINFMVFLTFACLVLKNIKRSTYADV